MKNPILILITALFFFITLRAFAQTQEIKGVVIDRTTKFPLIGASVYVLNSNPLIGTITDEFGVFELKNLSECREGEYLRQTHFVLVGQPQRVRR